MPGSTSSNLREALLVLWHETHPVGYRPSEHEVAPGVVDAVLSSMRNEAEYERKRYTEKKVKCDHGNSWIAMNKIDVFVRLYPWMFSLFTLLLGLVIGAQLNYVNALRLARRKELIDVIERVRPILEGELTEMSPSSKKPEPSDLNLIGRKLPRRKRDGYSEAVLRYKNGRDSHTVLNEETMGFEYADEKQVEDAINNLLSHLEYQ